MPLRPGASGNMATEDVTYMLEDMGFSTGLDPAPTGSNLFMDSQTTGRRLPSHISQLGPIKTSFPYGRQSDPSLSLPIARSGRTRPITIYIMFIGDNKRLNETFLIH